MLTAKQEERDGEAPYSSGDHTSTSSLWAWHFQLNIQEEKTIQEEKHKEQYVCQSY